MANYSKEPWNNPAKNTVATSPSRMNGKFAIKAILVDTNGEPYKNGAQGQEDPNLAVLQDKVQAMILVGPDGEPYKL